MPSNFAVVHTRRKKDSEGKNLKMMFLAFIKLLGYNLKKCTDLARLPYYYIFRDIVLMGIRGDYRVSDGTCGSRLGVIFQ